MNPVSPRNADILVAGDSLAAWLSALALRHWRPDLAVCVAPYHGEDSKVADPVVIARPEARRMLEGFGLTEAELISACDASFLLATHHRGWAGEGSSFHQALGAFGAPANGAAFHHYYLRMQAAGAVPPFSAFSLAARMAQAGKFIHPSKNPRALESAFSYCLAIDAERLCGLVKEEARARGVDTLPTRVMGTAWSEGRIQHLLLDDGSSAKAGFYLDCTGTARGLSGAAGWTAIAAPPCRREVETIEADTGNFSLATTTAHPAGWSRETALQTRSVAERFHHAPDAVAHFGYLAAPWRGNCLALGRAACTLPALHAPAFSLLVRELGLFGQLLPADIETMRVEMREYNRRALTAYGHMRDAQLLFELARARASGAPEPAVSDSLARKLEQFVSRGRVVMFDEEFLTDSEWIACLLGLGFTPERVSPLALTAPVEAARANYQRFAETLGKSVARMPDQQTYIRHMKAELARETGPDAV